MNEFDLTVPISQIPAVDPYTLMEHGLASDPGQLAVFTGLNRTELDAICEASRTGTFYTRGTGHEYDEYLSALEYIAPELARQGAQPIYTDVYRDLHDLPHGSPEDSEYDSENTVALDAMTLDTVKNKNIQLAMAKFGPEFERGLSLRQVAMRSWLILLRVLYLAKVEAQDKAEEAEDRADGDGEINGDHDDGKEGDGRDEEGEEAANVTVKRRGRPRKVDSARASVQPSTTSSTGPRRSLRLETQLNPENTISNKKSRGRGRPRKVNPLTSGLLARSIPRTKSDGEGQTKNQAGGKVTKYRGRGRPRATDVFSGDDRIVKSKRGPGRPRKH